LSNGIIQYNHTTSIPLKQENKKRIFFVEIYF